MSPVLGEDGSVIGASTIAHDLSDYVENLKTLQESDRRAAEALSTLETLQSTAPVGLGFVDREFRLVHLNEMLAAVNGSTVQDQIGKTVAEVVPAIWPQVEALYRKVLEDGATILNVEVSGEIAAEPGRQHHWLASYYPVHLDTEIIGVGLVVVDVTDRRDAEEFRSIVMDHMAEGLVTLDCDGQITYANAAATKMLGWTEAELHGKNMHALVHFQREDGTPILESECELVRTRTRNVRMDNEVFTCKNGSRLPVALSATPILSGGTGQGVVLVFRDVTTEKAERHRVMRELTALTWVGRIREALDEDRFVLYSQPIVALTGGQPGEELLLRMVDRKGEVILPGVFLGEAE